MLDQLRDNIRLKHYSIRTGNALLFLYREVLAMELPGLKEVTKTKVSRRLQMVLTKQAVRRVLERMPCEPDFMARLLCGTGRRVMEGMRLQSSYDIRTV